jgi:hypothetical protein
MHQAINECDLILTAMPYKTSSKFVLGMVTECIKDEDLPDYLVPHKEEIKKRKGVYWVEWFCSREICANPKNMYDGLKIDQYKTYYREYVNSGFPDA